ncbi:hypothetical protein CSUI_001789 [Cystoisospora suis]|uniref:Uncharacterized protein n=1 Tax=Cystoisospora suis TaxID=483139 RepID=A0A2C6KW81_9APIC|nr:hypothetical protein CSUI_001789 [Cystoisospora suis]
MDSTLAKPHPRGGTRQDGIYRDSSKQTPTFSASKRRVRSRGGTRLSDELSVVMRALKKPSQSSYRCDDFRGVLFFIPKEAAQYCMLDPPGRSPNSTTSRDPDKLSLWSNSVSCSRRPSVSAVRECEVGRLRENVRREGNAGRSASGLADRISCVSGRVSAPAEEGAPDYTEEVDAAVDDYIPCLFYRWPTSDKLLLHVHGLDEDLGMAAPLLQAFHQRLRINVIAMEFPGYGICSRVQAEPISPKTPAQNSKSMVPRSTFSVLPEAWLPGMTAAGSSATSEENGVALSNHHREDHTQQDTSPAEVSAERPETKNAAPVTAASGGRDTKVVPTSDSNQDEMENLLKFLVNLRILLAFVLQRLRVPPQSVYLSAKKLAAGPVIELCSFSDLMLGGDVAFGGLILFQPLFVPDMSASSSALESPAGTLRQSLSLPFRFTFGSGDKERVPREVSPPVQNFTLATFRMSAESAQTEDQTGDPYGPDDKSCRGLPQRVARAPETISHAPQAATPAGERYSFSDSSVGHGRDSSVPEAVSDETDSSQGGAGGSSAFPAYLRRRASCSSSSLSTLSHSGGKFALSALGKPRVSEMSTGAPVQKVQDGQSAQQTPLEPCLLKDQLHAQCFNVDAASAASTSESLSAGGCCRQDRPCNFGVPVGYGGPGAEGQQSAPSGGMSADRDLKSNCICEPTGTRAGELTSDVGFSSDRILGESQPPAADNFSSSIGGCTSVRSREKAAATCRRADSIPDATDRDSPASQDDEAALEDTEQDGSTVRNLDSSAGERTPFLDEDSEPEEGPLGIFSRLRSSMSSTLLGENAEGGVLGAELPLLNQIRQFLSRSFDPSPEPEEGGRTAAIVQAAIERKRRLLIANQKKICRQLPSAFTFNQLVPHIREVTCPLLCMRRRAHPWPRSRRKDGRKRLTRTGGDSASANDGSSSGSLSPATSSKTLSSAESDAEEASLSDNASSTSLSSRSSRTSGEEGCRSSVEGLVKVDGQNPDSNKQSEQFEAVTAGTSPRREGAVRSTRWAHLDRKFKERPEAAGDQQLEGRVPKPSQARSETHLPRKAKKQDGQERCRAKRLVGLVRSEEGEVAEEEETSVALAVDVLMAEAGSTKKETEIYEKYDTNFFRTLDNFFWAGGFDASGEGVNSAAVRLHTSPRSLAERLSVQTAPLLEQARRRSTKKAGSLIKGICIPLCMFEVPPVYRRREAMLREEKEDGEKESTSWLHRAFSAYASYFNLLGAGGSSE